MAKFCVSGIVVFRGGDIKPRRQRSAGLKSQSDSIHINQTKATMTASVLCAVVMHMYPTKRHAMPNPWS